MELLDLAKKLRREVKKAGIEMEKLMRVTNSELRVQRGAATGGVKEKRLLNLHGLKALNDQLEEANYTVNEVISDKDLTTVSLTVNPEYIKYKGTIVFNTQMLKGKVSLVSIVFTDKKTEETLEVTLKDVKESLKSVTE